MRIQAVEIKGKKYTVSVFVNTEGRLEVSSTPKACSQTFGFQGNIDFKHIAQCVLMTIDDEVADPLVPNKDSRRIERILRGMAHSH